LEGNWQQDVLFELQQAMDAYDFIQGQLTACDQQLRHYVAALPDRDPGQLKKSEADGEKLGSEEKKAADGEEPSPKNGKRKKKNNNKNRKTPRGNEPKFDEQGNEPKFDLRVELIRICGVDLTTIDGVNVITAQTLISELGTDMTRWRTENHLVSWLKLAPSRQVSGGKLIRHEKRKIKNRATEALRMAASTLERSDSYLGARYRHLKGRLGAKKAIKAMAAYLARLMYRMLTHGQEWVDKGAREHEKRRAERDMRSLERKAAAYGYRLAPAA
jgi:hypothetical protein